MTNPRKPWDYPDCPECDSDVFVAGRAGRPEGEYRCHACGTLFETEVQDAY